MLGVEAPFLPISYLGTCSLAREEKCATPSAFSTPGHDVQATLFVKQVGRALARNAVIPRQVLLYEGEEPSE